MERHLTTAHRLVRSSGIMEHSSLASLNGTHKRLSPKHTTDAFATRTYPSKLINNARLLSSSDVHILLA